MWQGSRLRRFTTYRPYQNIVTDVTELRWDTKQRQKGLISQHLWDLYNGEIISWNIGLHPNVDFIVSPLNELMGLRPKTSCRMAIHSYQGFQYQNGRYINILKSNKIFQSLSRKATCLDNACIESFFNQLKVGTVHKNNFKDYNYLNKAVKEYISYYNNYRIKQKLGGMSPVEYRIHSSQKIA